MFCLNVRQCLIRLLRINKLAINLCLYKERFNKATLLSTKTTALYKSLVAEYPHLLPTSQIILNVKILMAVWLQITQNLHYKVG